MSVDDAGNPVQVTEDQWQRHQVSLAGCGTATVKFGVQVRQRQSCLRLRTLSVLPMLT